jgi:hypothetical protein
MNFDRARRLLRAVNRYLPENSIKIANGTIVDATIIGCSVLTV